MSAAAGFLGLNGSGKSTLMRILAGEDKDFNGEMFKAEGIHVAYLEQEPRLDSGATVDDNIRPAVARMQSVLNEYNQVRGAVALSLPPLMTMPRSGTAGQEALLTLTAGALQACMGAVMPPEIAKCKDSACASR